MTPEELQAILDALKRIEDAVNIVAEKIDENTGADFGYPIKSELENVTELLRQLVDAQA